MSNFESQTLGAGPDVVMLHGWAMNSGVWGEFATDLSRRYRLTLVDLPGHGVNSHFPLSPLDELLDAISETVPARAAWLGWSLGGMLALAYARRFGSGVTSLVALGTNLKFVQTSNWPNAMPASDFEAFAESLVVQPEETIKRFVALQCLGNGFSGAQVRVLQAEILRSKLSGQGVEQGLDLLAKLDLREDLSALDIPVLAVFGERDRLVPVPVAEDWANMNKLVRTKVVFGAGHAPFLSHKAELISAIDAFWAGHVASV